MGHEGMGWTMQGWGASCRVGHTGVGGSHRVGWVCLGGVGMGGHVGVGWVMVGWGGSSRGGVSWSYRGGMGWVMKNIKILNCWCYKVSNPANQNQICRVLNVLNMMSANKIIECNFSNSHSTFYE